MLSLGTAEPELGDRRGRVFEQARTVRLVRPRAGDDRRAVHRPEVVLVHLDDRVDGVGGDEPTLDQQRLDRRDALLDVGERSRMMAVVVIVVIMIVVVVAHSR